MKAPGIAMPCTIGVFSSSSPISATVPVRYDRGVAYLESKGFTVVHGQQYRKQDFYRSGSIQERVEEFNQLLYREDIPILMASIGGNNTNSILPYIDYDYLKAHPKIIIGYSNVTALLLAIYAKTGLVTFYGPAVASSFGELPPFVDETFTAFYELVCGKISYPTRFLCPHSGPMSFSIGAPRTVPRSDGPTAGAVFIPALPRDDWSAVISTPWKAFSAQTICRKCNRVIFCC